MGAFKFSEIAITFYGHVVVMSCASSMFVAFRRSGVSLLTSFDAGCSCGWNRFIYFVLLRLSTGALVEYSKRLQC